MLQATEGQAARECQNAMAVLCTTCIYAQTRTHGHTHTPYTQILTHIHASMHANTHKYVQYADTVTTSYVVSLPGHRRVTPCGDPRKRH